MQEHKLSESELAALIEKRLRQVEQKQKEALGWVADEGEILTPPTLPDQMELINAQVERATIRAALSGYVDPNDLLDNQVPGPVNTQVLTELTSQCIISEKEGRIQWFLRQEARTDTLNALIHRAQLFTSLQEPLPPADAFGAVLRKVLQQGSAYREQSTQDLLQVTAVLESLSGVHLELPDVELFRKKLEAGTYLQVYKTMTQDFVGRNEELSLLKAFVEKNETDALWSGLILRGLGGAGKSALLARFARTVVEEKMATLCILDFDLPGMGVLDTYWLQAEMARQVGLQYPELSEALRAARHRARELKQQQQPTGGGVTQTEASERMYTLVTDISNTLQEVGLSHRPILLVLDTFEEVVQQDATEKVMLWVRQLADMLTPVSLKVIISGRLFDDAVADLTKKEALEQLEINELEKEQAVALLRQLGTPGALAKRVVRSTLLPKRPLELKLLARLVESAPTEAEAILSELENQVGGSGASSSELFNGIVYRRVLLRIQDETVRRLAHPGLVLRYLNTALIHEVLVPALKLDPLTPKEAVAAVEGLASYGWLAIQKDGNVWHRPDLRHSMLKIMWAKEPLQARRISEAAIRYFASEGSEGSRVEWLYHRLMILENGESLDDVGLPELKSFSAKVGGYINDLPRPARVLVEYAAKGKVSIMDMHLLPNRYFLAALNKLGNRLFTSGQIGKALQLIEPSLNNGSFFDWEEQAGSWAREVLFCSVHWDILDKWLNLQQRRGFNESSVDLVHLAYLTALISEKRRHQWRRDLYYFAQSKNLYDTNPRELLKPAGQLLLTRLSALLLICRDDRDGRQANYEEQRLGEYLFSVAREERWYVRNLYRSAAWQPTTTFWRNITLLSRLHGLESPPTCRLTLEQLNLSPAWLQNNLALEKYYRSGPFMFAHLANRLDQPTLQFSEIEQDYVPRPFFRKATEVLRRVDDLQREYRSEWFLEMQISELKADRVVNLLRGPDPEFRLPVKFALLDAFARDSNHEAVAGLFLAVLPYRLEELETSQFAKAWAYNREAALEPLIELADRCWKLGELIIRAQKERPRATKLQWVERGYRHWDRAVEKAIYQYALLINQNNHER